ncbi:MAG: exodeoxyribonuclease VII large subunit, partial [Actinobacteria bacterium]
ASLQRERRLLAQALRHRVNVAAVRVQRVAERPAFRDPHALLAQAAGALDDARMRLDRAIPDRLARDAQRVEFLRSRLFIAGGRVLERPCNRVGLSAARLHDLSPLAILARGYSASFTEDGTGVISSITQVAPGDRIVVRVADGRISASVTETRQEA